MRHNRKLEIEFPTSGRSFKHGMAAVAQFQEESHRVVPFVRSHGELVEPFSPWAEDASSIVYQIELARRPDLSVESHQAILNALAHQGVTVRAA
jgi:hypothetical protein